jgi:AbiV family abortive infection protein
MMRRTRYRERGIGRRTVALAIIALEELGKALVYVTAAVRPDLRHQALKDLKDHKVKQLASVKMAVAGLITGDPAKATTAREHAVFFLMTVVSDALTGPIPSRREAEEFVKNVEMGGHADPARTKEAALYVDLAADGLKTPERVAHLSTYYIDDLEWKLDRCAVLPDLVRNDKDWEEIARAVRTVLPRRHEAAESPGQSGGRGS